MSEDLLEDPVRRSRFDAAVKVIAEVVADYLRERGYEVSIRKGGES